MKTLTIISFFISAQIMAFGQSTMESIQEQILQILPAGDYQLTTAAVKPENEDMKPLPAMNVQIRIG